MSSLTCSCRLCLSFFTSSSSAWSSRIWLMSLEDWGHKREGFLLWLSETYRFLLQTHTVALSYLHMHGAFTHLSNQGFVFLHEFIEVLLVFFQSLQEVGLLKLQLSQLFIHLWKKKKFDEKSILHAFSVCVTVSLTRLLCLQMLSSSSWAFSSSMARAFCTFSASTRRASLSSS